DLTVALVRVDPPGRESNQLAVLFGDGYVLVGRRIVEPGQLLAIVLAPVAVLVVKDRRANGGTERFLEERPENLDGEVEQAIEIVVNICANLHECTLLRARRMTPVGECDGWTRGSDGAASQARVR